MNENIKEKWQETTESMIDDIKGMDAGTPEKSKAIDDVCKFQKVYIEMVRTELETEEKQARRLMEDEHYRLMREDALKKEVNEETARQEQNKIQLIDIAAKYGYELTALGFTMACAVFMNRQGYEYEKEATITSFTFKNVLSAIRPRILR